MAAVVVHVAALPAQSLTVRENGGSLRIQAKGFRFIEGRVLERLREGRTVRVDFELDVLEMPGGPIVTQHRQGFTLSFDLWEERFAVTRIGTPPRSISHLRPGAAEAWCLDNLAVPAAALARIGPRTPFWIRLAYRVQDSAPPPRDDTGTDGFTLATLIDLLSRRRGNDEPGRAMEAGPFRLSN